MVIIRLDTAEYMFYLLKQLNCLTIFTRVAVDCVTNFLRRTTSRKFIIFYAVVPFLAN